jgi:xanthine/uracil permease
MTGSVGQWSSSWLWSLPLIVLTVVIHVLGLGLIRDRAIGVWSAEPESRRDHAMFALVMGAAVLLVTVLHAFEGARMGDRLLPAGRAA